MKTIKRLLFALTIVLMPLPMAAQTDSATIKLLEKEMKEAAKNYDFERAAEIRDIILETKANLGK